MGKRRHLTLCSVYVQVRIEQLLYLGNVVGKSEVRVQYHFETVKVAEL